MNFSYGKARGGGVASPRNDEQRSPEPLSAEGLGGDGKFVDLYPGSLMVRGISVRMQSKVLRPVLACWVCWGFLLCFSLMTPGLAGEVQVAVATNFAAPMKQIAAAFQQATGHKALLSFGATAKLYAQIKNGAPFDILLAADQTIPGRLIQEHDGIAGSQFTYAVGKLVLWSATKNVVDAHGAVLKKGNFAQIAIASPQAPYGLAARETLKNLHLSDTFSDKIVQGESIGQTYFFIASGNAILGFIALSQVWESNKIKSGSAWIVPQHLYPSLRQDAVLLLHGENNPAARALLDYLKSSIAKQIMHSYGYLYPSPSKIPGYKPRLFPHGGVARRCVGSATPPPRALLCEKIHRFLTRNLEWRGVYEH